MTKKQLRDLFKFEDPIFLQIIEILLGEKCLQIEHQYHTNIDIVSMVVAWGLELGKEEMSWVMERCMDVYQLYSLTSILARAQSNAGFLLEGDDAIQDADLRHPLQPFVRWNISACHEERHTEALIAWDELIVFLHEEAE